jgi:ABC-type lipoprotein release transport system permease subunit
MVRRKGKNAALVAVYAVIVFTLASVMFFASAFRKEALAVLADAPQIIVQRVMAGRHDLIPLGAADQIRSLRGVRAVRGRLWGYYHHPAAGSNYTVMVSEQFAYGENDAMIGSGVLRSWGTLEDGRLYLKAYNGEVLRLNVAEVFSAGTNLATADLILMSETAFKRLTGMPDGVATDLAVAVRNEKECGNIARKISKLLPDTRQILRAEITRTYESLFDWRSGYVVVLLSGAVLAFFIFAWEKATGLSAEEKSEIGILKALGWNTTDVLVMKFWEGCVISLSAFLIGAIAAYLHVFLASAPLFEHALKGWAVLYPTFRLDPAISAYQIGVLFFLTVVPYALLTVIPAWRVATTDPDLVMRQS